MGGKEIVMEYFTLWNFVQEANSKILSRKVSVKVK